MLPDVLGELLVVKFGLVKKKPLLVGVSGGPDSLCLLDALHKAGFLITVAHFDHMLRPTSSQDAQKVAAEAGQRGLAFIVGQEDISLFSSQMKLSIEEAARVARYHFLFEKAAAIQAQAVVVGHNADDQVETILMHFIRGAGLDGLGGMHSYSLPNPWSKEIPLVRPLLGVWRSEIEEYCRTEKLTPIEDETNNQTKYFRNKLRHELIPELAAYNPQIKQRLVNMGEVLRQDAVLIAETLAIAWKECVKTEDPKWIIFNRTMVNTKNLAVRRMLLRQVMNQLAPDLRDLDYQVVERGIQFIQDPGEARRMDLLAGWEMAVWLGDILIHQTGIFPDDPHIPCMAVPELLVTSPGSVDLGGGWHFYAADREEPDHQGLDPFPTDTLSIWLDAEEVDFPLTIRTVQAGDRFNPLGMGSQTQKVSDVFTNAHIPAPYRTKWPLVFSRDKLIWIPGIKPAEFCRVKKSTRKILALRVEKVDQ